MANTTLVEALNPLCPNSFFTRGDSCQVVCSNATWTDVSIFFLGNYAAHAVTVITYPGESIFTTIVTVFIALLFPSAGVYKALHAISTLAVFAQTELQKAARAGALCTIVRMDKYKGSKAVGLGPWRILQVVDMDMQFRLVGTSTRYPGWMRWLMSRVPGGLEPDQEPSPIMSAQIHGIRRLPKGYALITLPPSAIFEMDPDEKLADLFKKTTSPQVTLAYSHNLLKIAISIGQLLFGVATLYRARGDQVERYGYAAFGLTAAPYAWMSLVNLVGNLMTPFYPTKFMVGSRTLDDLRDTVGRKRNVAAFPIDGTVGRITRETEDMIYRGLEISPPEKLVSFLKYLSATIFLSAVPLAIIGGLSRFKPGSSEFHQRIWLLIWLVFGICLGPTLYFVFSSFVLSRRNALFRLWEAACQVVLPDKATGGRGVYRAFYVVLAILAAALSAPAVGGFVIVGKMLIDYGSCVRIS